MKNYKIWGNLKKEVLIIMLVTVNIFYISTKLYCQDCSKVRVDKFTKEKSADIDIYYLRGTSYEKMYHFRFKSDNNAGAVDIFITEMDSIVYHTEFEKAVGMQWREHKLDYCHDLYLLFEDNQTFRLTGQCIYQKGFIFNHVQYSLSNNENNDKKVLVYLKTHKLTDIRITNMVTPTDIHLTDEQKKFFNDVLNCFDNL